MSKYYIPFYKDNSVSRSLLLLDNHGSHTSDTTSKAFEDNDIKHLYLAPNTTCVSQPVDVGIGGVIKGKIKGYFEDWVIDNWENNTFVKYNEKKKKYTYTAPNRDLIVNWILRAFDETSKETIIKGKKIFMIYLIMLAFDRAGVCNKEQQVEILNNKIKDLFITHDNEEFVHVEKEPVVDSKILKDLMSLMPS